MMVWTVGVVASVIGLWAGYTHLYEGGLGQPDYRLIQQEDGVEFREYQPFIIASTTPSTAPSRSALRRTRAAHAPHTRRTRAADVRGDADRP